MNGHVHGHTKSHVAGVSQPAHPAFDSIPDTIEAFGIGEFVVVLDNPARENEGDLIIAAEDLTAAKMAFMIRYTSGYICAPMPVSRAVELDLPQMVSDNADPNRTAYAVTVDANVPGITTGISAHDRALTCRMLADPGSKPTSFRRPGHVLPLQAREGGIRARHGHTEAAVELCRLAGKQPVGVICEMITDGEVIEGKTEMVGGDMMKRDELLAFGKKWGLKVCTIDDMVNYVEGKEGKLGFAGSDY
ncbi:3,4-dihydroxy-2-butanone 4-phosphate synthase [Patellaria atrata CBS 101060]|uniref:3,4-dihydroxy-2-butanone 4-phosphate synthase n=1 Tax=Patellaria atrata CBS 101060 TaxID=1346257 RepID=A0A9P4SHM8_9PEZI|nr:3,4-dihydroxy-2-butanone 4-phosphate synthase [Patellaria atrata CBS 101060]